MSGELVVLGVYLLGYCGLHSWLASLACKRRAAALCAARWPAGMRYYRLLFNLSAMLLLLPVGLLLWRNSGTPLWQWSGATAWLMDGLALAALLAFVHSLRDYDLAQFSGTAQWRRSESGRYPHDPEQQARFHIGCWHRWVRHPWYFFALVLLWSRSMDAAHLITYGIFSLYLVIGSRLEERKLKRQFGDAYRRYCQRVPGLVPLPWRHLPAQQALELARLGNDFNTAQRADATNSANQNGV